MNAKPELEIYADDVACAHGATTGELDDDQVFYLQSRGIPQAEARALLIKAFLADVFDEIEDDVLRGQFVDRVDHWLANRSAVQSGKGSCCMNAPMKTTLNIDAVRGDFPILNRTVYDKPLVYLDNAASAQKPRQVIEALSHVYEHEYANVHRGAHYLSGGDHDNFRGKSKESAGFHQCTE